MADLTVAQIRASRQPFHKADGTTSEGYAYSYAVYLVPESNKILWCGTFEDDETLLGNTIKIEIPEEGFDRTAPAVVELLAQVEQQAKNTFNGNQARMHGKGTPVKAQEAPRAPKPKKPRQPKDTTPKFGTIVEKTWGYEHIQHATEKFTVKHLVYTKAGNYCSLHSHTNKYEEFKCIKGSFRIELFQVDADGRLYNPDTVILKVNDLIRIDRNRAHRMTALENNSVLLEVSDFDSAEDNVRYLSSMEKA